MKVTIKEVKTRKELKSFVHYPNALYKGNKFYVPTLESADLDVLNPNKNHAFEFCEGQYWLAYDESGNIVGRIAGIINHQYNKKVNQAIARFGFMDFIDVDDVVDALFDRFQQWAKEKGMNTFSGPLGFLEFDAAGVLVEGFDQLPTAYGKYNFPYYEKQLLRIGYQKETDWVEYRVTVPDYIPDNYEKASRILEERYKIHIAPIKTKKQLVKYFDEMSVVLNNAYRNIHGYSELSPGQIDDLKKQFVPNLDIRFVAIVLNEENRVVAFGICMPSVSEAMQKAKGKLFPFGWYHILHAIRHQEVLDTLLIGIDDDYRKKGVNALIFNHISKGIRERGIKYIETTRELEDNNSVQNLWNKFETHLHKRARCYYKNI